MPDPMNRLRTRIERQITHTEFYIQNLPRANDGKVRRAYESAMSRAQGKVDALRWVLDNLPES